MAKKTEKKTVTNAKQKAPSVFNQVEFEKLVQQGGVFRGGPIQNSLSLLRTRAITNFLNIGKDINFECGYPNVIVTAEYKEMYKRSGTAKRVVRILPEETWASEPTIYETEDAGETVFEKELTALMKKRNILQYLQRIDSLSGIGEFGVLLLGINDGKELSVPVEGINLATGEKAGNKKHELIYLKPFDQSAVDIKTVELSRTSPRYGFPTSYNINFESGTAGDIKMSQEVHWTRVIHIADGRDSSEVYGTPRMECVYNRLLDLRKILGGSGEMFWRGGFPGLSFESEGGPEAAEMDVASLKDQVENYMQGLQRYFASEGVTVKSLAPQVAGPKEHVDVNMRQIAISLGIPYRIFLGSEEAKLASSEDKETWNARLSRRQYGYVNPFIIRPCIDRLIILSILPEPKEYFIDWPDLSAPTDKDIADIGKVRTESLSAYVASGINQLIPPVEYLTLILGMTMDEAKAIEKASGLFADLEKPLDEDIDDDDIEDIDDNNEEE